MSLFHDTAVNYPFIIMCKNFWTLCFLQQIEKTGLIRVQFRIHSKNSFEQLKWIKFFLFFKMMQLGFFWQPLEIDAKWKILQDLQDFFILWQSNERPITTDIFLNLLKCALQIFIHCFWLGITCYFLVIPGSRVAWSCRDSNPGPSDSQPDAMAIRQRGHPYIKGHLLFYFVFSSQHKDIKNHVYTVFFHTFKTYDLMTYIAFHQKFSSLQVTCISK